MSDNEIRALARPGVEENYSMPVKYGWVISKCFLDFDKGGTYGPVDTELTPSEILAHPKAKKFRLYDDDKTLYYEGFMVHDGSSDGFEPLDDFGEPNAGCTRIAYWENGKWETY